MKIINECWSSSLLTLTAYTENQKMHKKINRFLQNTTSRSVEVSKELRMNEIRMKFMYYSKNNPKYTKSLVALGKEKRHENEENKNGIRLVGVDLNVLE